MRALLKLGHALDGEEVEGVGEILSNISPACLWTILDDREKKRTELLYPLGCWFIGIRHGFAPNIMHSANPPTQKKKKNHTTHTQKKKKPGACVCPGDQSCWRESFGHMVMSWGPMRIGQN